MLIEKKWPKKIKEFREREDSKRTPSKLCRALKVRPKFQKIEEQPEYMGGDQVKNMRKEVYTVEYCLNKFLNIKDFSLKNKKKQRGE